MEALSRENAAALFGEQDLIYLIFDYEKRNPLTGDACLSVWREEGAG